MVEYVKSGIKEFDKIIGGFIKGQTILLAGNPGSGKTTFATQFLYEGLLNGETTLYVGLVEPKADFMTYMGMIGFDLEKYEKEGKFLFLEMLTIKDIESISILVKNIIQIIKDYKITRLVIDSITALEQAIKEDDARAFFHNTLLRGLKIYKVTSILIADLPFNTITIGYGVEEFIFDSVLILELTLYKGLPRRRLIVKKLRGQPLPFSHFDIVIGDGGIELIPPYIYPISGVIGEKCLPFGIKELNDMLSGGIRAGTSTIFIGPSGSGKTLLALDFVRSCANLGESCIFVSLEESIPQIISHLKRMGATSKELQAINLYSHSILIKTPCENFQSLREMIEQIKPSVIVIDGLTALKRVYSTNEFNNFVRGLSYLCKSKNITFVVTLIGSAFKEEVGLSTAFDNIIALFLEKIAIDEIVRKIAVVKARGIRISSKIYNMNIEDGGRIVVYK
ncbi:MAG: ATPase domain-containing protein [Nitrososphaeria archaeon]